MTAVETVVALLVLASGVATLATEPHRSGLRRATRLLVMLVARPIGREFLLLGDDLPKDQEDPVAEPER